MFQRITVVNSGNGVFHIYVNDTDRLIWVSSVYLSTLALLFGGNVASEVSALPTGQYIEITVSAAIVAEPQPSGFNGF